MNKDTIEIEQLYKDLFVDIADICSRSGQKRERRFDTTKSYFIDRILAWHNKKVKEARVEEAKTLRAYFYQFSWGHYDPIAIFNDRIVDLKSNKE